jgi:Peptidase family M1 domain
MFHVKGFALTPQNLIKQYMKRSILLSIILSLFVSNTMLAQSLEGKAFRNSETEHGIDPQILERSAGTSGTGSNIDVISHKIFWRINPDTTVKYIKGSVQFNFKTTVNNVTTITFDLRSVLLLDSIRFRTNQFTLGAGYTRTGNIVTLNLGATLANNFIDSFIVYYKGVPPAVSGAAQGYQRYADAIAGNVVNTLSESYEDRDWWPCKHDMQDKIDSMEITVSVPWASPAAKDTFWVATNGRMVDSTIVGASRIFKFKTKYPIASYLVFLNVARFQKVYRTVNTGTTNVPVVYNLLSGNTTRNNNAIIAMDKSNLVLQALSAKIGEYPFRLEKHGFADGLQGAGGMEHQTMSSIVSSSLSSIDILVHEMAHQWFGDNVTFAHWNDLWLAEGFAEYSTAWYQELVPSLGGASGAFTARNAMKTNAIALSSNSAWIPNANAGTSALIWSSNYGSTVYQRGAMAISMLRTMCGDSIFSAAMTKYQTGMAGKAATTDTLRNYFNRELGRDISVFFDDYVGGSDTITTRLNSIGSPINTINWSAPTTYGQSGKRLIISMGVQTKTAGSNVAYFRGPVQIHVKGALAANDTTITIFDWGGGNLSYAGKGISIPVAGNKLTFDLSFVPTTILYDDSSRIMSTGTITPVPTLEGYVWLGTTNTVWSTATNWAGGLVPPSGGDVTIATAVTNQPVLPAGNTTVGPLTILGANKVIMGGNTLTLNNTVRSTGTLSGSPTATLVVADQAGTINFDQTSATTRSLLNLTLNPTKTSATLGTGLLEIYGGLNVPTSSTLNVRSANLLIR